VQELQASVVYLAEELELEPEIRLVDVPGAEEVARSRFLGSPTVRVNGRDVEPGADERRDFSFSCRVCPSEQGSAGWPHEDWIRDALRKANG
jgi:hypothetical protein